MLPEYQLRLLVWLSRLMELMGNAEFRNGISGENLAALCALGKNNIDATVALMETDGIALVGVDKDIEELDRMFRL